MTIYGRTVTVSGLGRDADYRLTLLNWMTRSIAVIDRPGETKTLRHPVSTEHRRVRDAARDHLG